MRKFNYRFVLSNVGILLMIEALFMLFSALIGEYYREEARQAIYLSAGITLLAGGVLTFADRALTFAGLEQGERKRSITKREVFLTVTLAWVTLALAGTLPYLLSGAIPSFTNAFFESMCGFSTTGSSTIDNLEAFPRSLHFWRSFSQWIGGIGIIIFVMSFMPIYSGGASGLFFDAEATGIAMEQVKPRVREIARNMFLIYFGLTLVGFFLLWAGPMNAFDAACHTLSSISTGGFSTRQAGLAYYASPYSEYVIIVLMFLGATNFMLLFALVTRGSLAIFKDEEFRWYASIILLATVGIAVSLFVTHRVGDAESSFRTALFQVVATVTTTGYTTADYQAWGPMYSLLFLGLMLFCGCQGSTSGGIKVSRLLVLAKNTQLVFKRQVHPNALYRVKINGKVIPENTTSRVMAFAFLYVTLAAVSAWILSMTGMTLDESIGVSFSSISSLGTGLGSYGPGGSYASASTFAKYYVCFLMLVGRLEIFTVLSLFVPSFWKR
ncbi:MAG: TrkH family potassium uptake protein [Fermentimonas sp.]|jgi:trk system potassium uptake protein TrkH